MNKKRKIIIYSIAIIVLILYLTFSYHGILFFTKAYNGLDYVIFNVLGDAILVGITTFISTKYISVYISKKEFDRNNQININIQEKINKKVEVSAMKKTMVIEGMSCGHCSARVEKALNALDGVSAKVDLEAKTAAIETEGRVSDEQLRAAVTDAGYDVVSLD